VYLPITIEVILKEKEADACAQVPTADNKALDRDVILTAQDTLIC
jgi:hypothetical protein